MWIWRGGLLRSGYRVKVCPVEDSHYPLVQGWTPNSSQINDSGSGSLSEPLGKRQSLFLVVF